MRLNRTRQRGMTLIEVLVAAGILAIVVPTLYVYYRQQAKTTRTLQSITVMDQLENELKVYLSQRFTSFLHCSKLGYQQEECPSPIRGNNIAKLTPTPPVPALPSGTVNCTSDVLEFRRWFSYVEKTISKSGVVTYAPTSFQLPSGALIRPAVSDSDIPAPVGSDNANYAAMRLRCVNNFSFKGELTTPGFDYRNIGSDGFYFCMNIDVRNYRDATGARSLANMGTVMLEARFSRFALGSMQPLTCDQLPGTTEVVRQAGLLYYTLHWRLDEAGKPPTYRTRNGSFLTSGIHPSENP